MLFKLFTAAAVSVFLSVIALVGFQTPMGLLIKYGISAVPFGDKAIHFSLMVLLSCLLYYSLNQRRINILGRNLLFSSLLLATGITIEEISQAFIPSRNFEIMDMVCNYAGIYLGSLLPRLLNLKHLSDADHFRSKTLSVQTVRHSTGPVHHEGGHGRRTARRLVRQHGRR